MRTKILTLALAVSLSHAASAKNTTTKVEQVTTAVTLDEDVDYVITSDTPFSVTGSIDITNTDHAVVIFEGLRPSEALSYLSFITVNGDSAVNDENCQVKMYASGSIIMPYSSDIKPLTVYSEQNFQGDSVNDFGLENSSGYMNPLTTAKLNNSIRSFKLKRGYMVTFANNSNGRGYNRCFIADTEDLEMATLPAALDSRISSYRIFKWNDAEKKGLANNTTEAATQALNVSWCYSFGLGEDRGIDCECVPHHIHESWPAIADIGKVTYSPHMKTNNEPGNSSDDSPATVAEVLANWESLMATGMRLCSPSSHDGSLSWLYEFMDSIDARGWRCDLIDLHCYWPEWNLLNQLEGWYTSYGRPLWISEFLWGASWNSNGIFQGTDGTASIANQQKNYDTMSGVLTAWNGYGYVERYAYWNSELDCSKIYIDGELTLLGEFYANMNSGIGYNKDYEFVPLVVCKYPSDFTVTYTESSRRLSITWTNQNMELTDSTLLELSFNGGEWTTLQKYASSELSSYSYNETFDEDFEKGTYTYRVHNYDVDGEERISKEITISLVGAEGTPGFQYGSLEISDAEQFNTSFDADGDNTPAVFLGLPTYNNTNTVPVNIVYRVSAANERFTSWGFPWNCGDYSQTYDVPETTDFMVISEGTHQYGDITMLVGESSSSIGNDSTWIAFDTPFPEGVTPVVITTVQSRNSVYPYMVKMLDITNEGFAVKMVRQAEADESGSSFVSQNIFYVAATPGQEEIDNNKILTVGRNMTDPVDGRRARDVNFIDSDSNTVSLLNPYILCGPQTSNYEPAGVYRISSLITEETEDGEAVTGLKIIRQKDDTNSSGGTDNANRNGDYMGWLVVSDNPNPNEEVSVAGVSSSATSSLQVEVSDGHIIVKGTDSYSVYALNGMQMDKNARLSKGVYIVRTADQAVKVLVP